MKIIILAAGRGTRLMPLTRNTPKPLIDLGDGYTLLERQIESIKKSGVFTEIVLVTGYLADQIDAKILNLQEDNIKIKTIYNPFYDVSNNLMSLWIVKEEMNSDFMITNGDNLFQPEIFSELYGNNSDGIFLSICKKDDFDEDDMKVTLSNGELKEVNKNIPIENADSESPGLSLVKGKKSINLFIRCLEDIVRRENSRDDYWLVVFNFIISQNHHVKTWSIPDNMTWQEVDFHLDIDKVIELLKISKSKKLKVKS